METIEVAPDATRDPDARRTRDLLAAHIAYTRWRAIRCWMVGIAIAVGAAEMLFTACGLMAVQALLLRVSATAALSAAGAWRQELVMRRRRNSLAKALGATVRLTW